MQAKKQETPLLFCRLLIVFTGFLCVGVSLLFGFSVTKRQVDLRSVVTHNSSSWKATNLAGKQFGQDSATVVVHADLPRLVLTSNLGRLLGLEGCLAGISPASDSQRRCEKIWRLRSVSSVFGPATFINTVAESIQQQVRQLRTSRDQGQFFSLALQYGLKAVPSIDDPNFVAGLVFDTSAPAGTPKQRFASLFPAKNTALIQIRFQEGASLRQRAETIRAIQRILAMPQWKMTGVSYVLTGYEPLAQEVSESLERDFPLMLAGVSLLVLMLVAFLTPSWWALPIVSAFVGVGVTLAFSLLVGVNATIAVVAVIPVLFGLAMNYGVQQKQQDRSNIVFLLGGMSMLGIAPALLIDVPIVRQFVLLLLCGIPCAVFSSFVFACLVTHLRSRFGYTLLMPLAVNDLHLRMWKGRLFAPVARYGRSFGLKLYCLFARAPALFLILLTCCGIVGWVIEVTRSTHVQAKSLVAGRGDAGQELLRLKQQTGYSGDVSILVRLPTPLTAKQFGQLTAARDQVMQNLGAKPGQRCTKATLCSAPSLLDFAASALPRDQRELDALLRVIPGSIRRSFISQDRRTVLLTFLVSKEGKARRDALTQIEKTFQSIPRLRADLVGFTALATQTEAELNDPLERGLPLLLATFFLGLLLFFIKKPRVAFWVLFVTAVASGCGYLCVWALGVSLSPLALIVAPLGLTVVAELNLLIASWLFEAQERQSFSSLPGWFVVAGSTLAGFTALAVIEASLLQDLAYNGVMLFGSVFLLLPICWLLVHLFDPAITSMRQKRAA